MILIKYPRLVVMPQCVRFVLINDDLDVAEQRAQSDGIKNIVYTLDMNWHVHFYINHVEIVHVKNFNKNSQNFYTPFCIKIKGS